MYKVFADNISIRFQKDRIFSSNISEIFFPQLTIDNYNSFLNELNRINVKEEVFIKSPDPLSTLKYFFEKLNWIEASGGIVQNTKNQKLLMIFRNGLWDIPKGKIEKNETPKVAAKREIEEECGIKNLRIKTKLSPTFHIYFGYGKHFIKKTHWFILETNEFKTSPQLEEGITETKWFNKNDLSLVQKNTFASINEVIEEFKLTHE